MKQFHTKRILQDIRELSEHPLIGLSAMIRDETYIREIVANVQVQEGIYSGLLVPILIRLPENYPLSAPSAYVQPGHPFNREFHEHIIGDGIEKSPICTDMTKNFADFFEAEKGSGWNPAYTIQGLLLQLQTFFAHPDLPFMPKKEKVEAMMQRAAKYKLNITIKRDGNVENKIHEYENPFPPMDLRWNPDVQHQQHLDSVNKDGNGDIEGAAQGNGVEEEKVNEAVGDRQFLEVQNKLVCPILKRNIIHDPTLRLGYPMMIDKDKFGRIHVTPVIEIMSRDAVKMVKEINRIGDHKYSSIFGEDFNKWVPIYINDHHFKQIKDYLDDICTDFFGSGNYSKPQETDLLKLLPPILVKTTVHFLKGNIFKSYAALDAYCQYHFMLRKLIEQYPKLQKEIDSQIGAFLENRANRHKRLAGDLGELLIKLSLSKYGLNNPDISYLFFQEALVRKVSWSMKEDSTLASKGSKADGLLKRFFSTATTSFEFYLLQYETAKLLINDETYKYQEKNYGCVNEETLKAFRNKLLEIQANVNGNWKFVVGNLGLEKVIPDEKTMNQCVVESIDFAQKVYQDDIYFATRNSSRY